jgi:hypothetical protein
VRGAADDSDGINIDAEDSFAIGTRRGGEDGRGKGNVHNEVWGI